MSVNQNSENYFDYTNDNETYSDLEENDYGTCSCCLNECSKYSQICGVCAREQTMEYKKEEKYAHIYLNGCVYTPLSFREHVRNENYTKLKDVDYHTCDIDFLVKFMRANKK